MKPFGVLALALFLCSSQVERAGAGSAAPAGGETFYTSPSGNDSWSGRLPNPNGAGTDGPFLTLAKAQQAMRASTTVKTITLRGGSYAIPSGLNLTRQDTGETWVAYGQEKPIIDGTGTGSVTMVQTDRMVIEGITFENLVPSHYPFPFVVSHSKNDIIRWNTFVNCRNGCLFGIQVTDSIIDSNVVDGQAPGNLRKGYGYTALTLTSGSTNNVISHNLIQHTEGGAIGLISGYPDPPANNNLIDRNLMRDVVSNVVDHGVIHVLDRTESATGNRITNNVIENVGGSGEKTHWTKAIYLDDLTSNTLVQGNICYPGCGQFALQIHGGDHNRIVDNIFDLSAGSMLGLYQDVHPQPGVGGATPSGEYPNATMAGNVIAHNIIYSSDRIPVPLWRVVFQDPQMGLPEVAGNLYFATNAPESNTGQIRDSSPIYADPHFSDPASGNFSMPANSPARSALHFPVLPTDQGPLPRPAKFPANP